MSLDPQHLRSSEQHRVLYAMGAGGAIAGVILSLVQWNGAWLAFSLLMFVGTAALAGIIDAVKIARRK